MRPLRWSSMLVFATACSTGVDDTTSVQYAPPQDRYAQVDEVRLHYLDWGGEGDLLLLVPGLSHTAHTYGTIAPALTDQFRVVAVTRRDHGASAKVGGPVDLDALADDLVGFLELFPHERVVLAGQSYGGLELPRVWRRLPERVGALIFLDAVYDWSGWAEPGPPFPGYFNPSGSYTSHQALESWFEQLYPELWGPEVRAHLISQTFVGSDGLIYWHFPVEGPHWGRYLEVIGRWTPAEYEGLAVPILSIQVEQGSFMVNNVVRAGAPPAVADTARAWADDLDNVLKKRGRDALAAAVPHAVMLHYEETHHWLHLQSPARVVADMKRFFEEHLSQ